MRILIVSGAGGGTAKKSVGKFFHLKEFGETLKKNGVEYKIIYESDYVVGFPTKSFKKFFTSKNKLDKLISDFKPDAVLVDRQGNFALEIIKKNIPLFVLLRGHYWLKPLDHLLLCGNSMELITAKKFLLSSTVRIQEHKDSITRKDSWK